MRQDEGEKADEQTMIWHIDPVYFWYVFIPVLLISLATQFYLQATMRNWGGVANSLHLSGMDVAHQLFRRTSLDAVPLEPTPGSLTDHYDPKANVVRLSETVTDQPSVAAMAVAAHELGHVQQYQTGSPMIRLRSFLVPALQFSPIVSYLCIMLGLFFQMVNLVWIGIFFFGLMVLFSLLTLPVEINASRRGLQLLDEARLLQTDNDARGARQVLNAAALTYLAAAVASLLQLLYYVRLARRASQ